jgi:predicted permease
VRQDLRHALRLLRRRPGTSALIVGILAIGIATTTVVFSLADAILWHPLPFRDAERLVRIRATAPAPGMLSTAPAALDGAIFEGVHPFALDSAIISIGGEPQGITIGELSPGVLSALGVGPIEGREFAANEYVAGSAVVIVGAELWKRQRALARSTDDRSITIEGAPYTIVGVMPAGFEFPVSRVALWRPYVPDPAGTQMTALGRLEPGVTIREAAAFAQTTVRATGGRPFSDLRIVPFVSILPSTAAALRVLLGAVALLLLIAVANASNIVQAEAVGRDTELAVRASLGASWPRLARQIITETLLVSAFAAMAALAFSAWALDMLVANVPYLMSFQALRPIGIDWRVLVFAALTALAAGVGASWLSVVRARRLDPQEALRGQISGLRAHARARSVLTVAQIAITLVLLTGAGLLGHSFVKLSRVDPGFDPRQLLDVEVQLPAWRYAGEDAMRAALERVRAEAMKLPEVADVTIAYSMPPDMESRSLDGFATARTTLASSGALVSTGVVDDRFFATLRIPLLAGRAFDSRDQQGGARAAIVSRAFAHRLWPDRDPLGATFRESPKAPWLTVVGVVGDVKNGSFEQALGPMAYYTARSQSPAWWYEGVIVRTTSAPDRLIPALRSISRRVLPDAPIVDIRTGYETIADTNARVTFFTALVIAFAAIALSVALAGVYGTFWCFVRQRTREIGVRMALGASPRDILRMVLGGSARLLMIGLIAGLPLSLAAAQVLKWQLFEVSSTDPATVLAVVAFLAAAAMGATYLPARRASSVDPMQALRHD